MKTSKWYLLLFICCASVMALSSCLNDNDDYVAPIPLTPAEKAQQIHAMAGQYNGKVYLFSNVNSAYSQSGQPLAVDSANIGITVSTDSSLVVNNMPLRLFVRSTNNNEIKEAVENAVAPFRGNIILYKNYGINYDYTKTFLFALWPYGTETTWTVPLPYTLNGESQNMDIKFIYQYEFGLDNGYNVNSYSSTNNYLQFFLLPNSVTFGDGSSNSSTDMLLVVGYK